MTLAINTITLLIWQASNYIVPLITVPYLARALGVEQFGLLAVASGIVGYVSLIVDWGFYFSAVQQTAQNASDPNHLRKLFWHVVLAKVLLGVGPVCLFLILAALVPSLNAVLAISLAYLLQVLLSIPNASWVLQGLERMLGFAVASLLGRFITVPLILLFVHTPDDVVLAAAIQGGSMLVSTIASLYLVSRDVPLRPIELSLGGALQQIKSGARLFLMTAGVNLYTQSNTVVLGAVAGPAEAGVFGGADRIRRALQGLTGPVSTAVFPRISKLVTTDMRAARRLVRTALIVQGGGSLALSVLMFALAQPIAVGFLGSGFAGAAQVLRILSPVPFLVGVSSVLGTNVMVPLGLTGQLAAITYVSGIISTLALVPLSYRFGAAGAAVAVVATEAMVVLALAAVLLRTQTFVVREAFQGSR